jgi:tetratricopeptide (TPR) repeat protein
MWLDADDVIPEVSIEKIKELKNTIKEDVEIVTMKYITHFDENGIPIFSSTRERLMKRSKEYKWMGAVHECIPLAGNVIYSDIEIWHKKENLNEVSTRNLKIYEAAEKNGKEFSPRELYYFARELNDHGKFKKAARYFEKFLNTGLGWSEDNITSCHNLAICYRILGKTDKILPILYRSFQYDTPRAEVCCEIGYYYKNLGNIPLAVKWFDLATRLLKPDSIGFILIDFWGYVPNIECCVCLCELGHYQEASIYNERAATFKPDSKAVAINREFLKTKLG